MSAAHPQGQDLRVDGMSPRAPMGVGPAPGLEAPMPTQQCLWSHDKY